MVGVMMRDQDVGQAPAAFRQRSHHGRGFRRVDGGGRTRGGVVQQNAVIVFEADEEMGLGRHSWLATPAWALQASTAFGKGTGILNSST